jgi:hypothetical protein
MTSIALHPTPTWRAVLREQIRAVALASQRPAKMALAVIAGFAASGIWYALYLGPRHGPGYSYPPGLEALALVIAVLLPALVWGGEDWPHRAYHWSMPVDRTTHALTKVFAGWVCLMIAVATLIASAAVLLWLTNVVARSHVDQGIPVWEWAMPFPAVTVIYGLISAPIVGSRYPARWLLGVAFAYTAANSVATMFHLQRLGRALEAIGAGYASFGSAVLGWVTVASPGQMPTPSAARWLSASLLWIAIATTAVVVAAHHRTSD